MNKQQSISGMNHFYSETMRQRIVEPRKLISIVIPIRIIIDVLTYTSTDVLTYTSTELLKYCDMGINKQKHNETKQQIINGILI